MSDLDVWLTIAVLAISTTATRTAFWLVGHHINIPPRVQDMLRYAPACALSAIIFPDLLLGSGGTLLLDWHNFKLMAALCSVGYYLLRRNMLETIVFGMLFFTGLRIWFQ